MKDRVLMSPSSQDRAVRAMAKDGSFRVITVRASDTVQAAIKAQHATGPTARAMGELMIGAALVRETMSPDQRLQMVIGSVGSIAVDAHPGGMTRALVRVPEGSDGQVQIKQDARMQVMRALYDGRLHQAVVEVFPEEGISQALRQYLLRSEQVESFLQVHCVVNGDFVLAAGGYIVQRLPEAGEVQFDEMASHDEAMGDISAELVFRDSDPSWLMESLMKEIPHVILEAPRLFFGCNCSEERVMAALTTLPRSDLQEIMDEGRSIESDCDYCGEHYDIGLESIKGLMMSQ